MRAVERDPHAIEQINDRGRALGHPHDRRLMVKEVPTRDRVFKVQIRGIALSPNVDGSVDPALSADAMAALHGHEADQLNFDTGFCEFHRGHEPGQSPSDHHHAPF